MAKKAPSDNATRGNRVRPSVMGGGFLEITKKMRQIFQDSAEIEANFPGFRCGILENLPQLFCKKKLEKQFQFFQEAPEAGKTGLFSRNFPTPEKIVICMESAAAAHISPQPACFNLNDGNSP